MEKPTWTWPSSRRWRLDLPTHSPASHEFRPAGPQGAASRVRWIEAARAAGLDAVAVTDHDTAAGISKLHVAALVSWAPPSPGDG